MKCRKNPIPDKMSKVSEEEQKKNLFKVALQNGRYEAFHALLDNQELNQFYQNKLGNVPEVFLHITKS